eukprot:CAMPEP_0203976624 /NCGR_PEP_ID=MMETSP0359-20131031/101205_1 /ASSEMBLY_ACC=CAM_ASM_000338 /TAXON_ID=268821 /ORGANISM="Scrippsiella Hangoei, Strain SHTV-5" /LENGTH=374 /DNA_ID=CAMNT_0050914829 /DNA_START=827 /DNA_END=1949 /DNA_ORIENTATION=+
MTRHKGTAKNVLHVGLLVRRANLHVGLAMPTSTSSVAIPTRPDRIHLTSVWVQPVRDAPTDLAKCVRIHLLTLGLKALPVLLLMPLVLLLLLLVHSLTPNFTSVVSRTTLASPQVSTHVIRLAPFALRHSTHPSRPDKGTARSVSTSAFLCAVPTFTLVLPCQPPRWSWHANLHVGLARMSSDWLPLPSGIPHILHGPTQGYRKECLHVGFLVRHVGLTMPTSTLVLPCQPPRWSCHANLHVGLLALPAEACRPPALARSSCSAPPAARSARPRRSTPLHAASSANLLSPRRASAPAALVLWLPPAPWPHSARCSMPLHHVISLLELRSLVVVLHGLDYQASGPLGPKSVLVLADLANLVHKSCLSNSSSFTHG